MLFGRPTLELVAGVYLLNGSRGCNVYLLADGAMPTIIDAGMSLGVRGVRNAVRDVLGSSRGVSYLLLTHSHRDHAGAAARLRRELGANIGIHAAEVGVPAERRPSDGAVHPRQVRWSVSRVEPDLDLTDGLELPVLGGLQVVHVPGHTPGSICLYLRERRVLFTGDLFVSYRDRLSRPYMGPESDRDAYLASLRRVRDLGAEAMLPGHGYPIYDDVHELLGGLIEQRAARSGASAWLRNLPRLIRFGIGLWRQDDLTRAQRRRDRD